MKRKTKKWVIVPGLQLKLESSVLNIALMPSLDKLDKYFKNNFLPTKPENYS